MASARFEGSARFEHLVAEFVEECARFGVELALAGAAGIVAKQVREMAALLGVTPVTVIRSYLHQEILRELAREAATDLELA
jgi:hypothetical protein